jgi:hypothetical protein
LDLPAPVDDDEDGYDTGNVVPLTRSQVGLRGTSQRRPRPQTQTQTRREATVMTLADYFKAALGWKPSQRPFHTSANRECGSCHAIKTGSELDVPVTPGRPDPNLCRECG